MILNNQIFDRVSSSDNNFDRNHIIKSYSDYMIDKISANAILEATPLFLGLIQVSQNNSSTENEINTNKLKNLEHRFTKQLISYLLEEDFEYGIESKACLLVKEQMKQNSLITKEWINNIYITNFSKPEIIIGILQIISRLEREEISPEGETIALASLSHKNEFVQECAIRVFESWGGQASLKILEQVHITTSWVKNYLDEVITDLKFEYVSQKNSKIQVASK